MGRRLYVGNLSYQTTDERLREAFASSGEVVFARVNIDRETNQSRGFGFVELATDDQAFQAIQDWNGTELDGRCLKVNEAVEKPRSGGPGPGRSHGGSPRPFSGSSGRQVDVYQSRGSAPPRANSGRDGGNPRGRTDNGGRGNGGGGGRGRRRDDDYGDNW